MLNKLQIDTASEILRNALRDKEKEIADKAFQADITKYAPLVTAYNKSLLNVSQQIAKLKAAISNNSKLDIDNSYNTVVNKIPKTIEEAENNSIIIVKGGSYPDYRNAYMPDTKKQKAEIERFILNLKLGTALMSDIDDVLKKIESIK